MAKLWKNILFRWGVIIAAVAVASLVIPGFGKDLLRADQFMPHATCYLRNPRIIFLHVSADLLIGFAYVAISTTLGYLVYKARKDIPFHWMFLAFGLFIITCGFTHFMEVWTVWQPVYWLSGFIKVICAAASVVTALALFPLVPKVFALIDAVKVSEERRVKLENANTELEAFAYSVSHDLRAPLRAMQGMAGALREDYGKQLDPQALNYMDQITSASRRMDTMIRDLLTYSKITRSSPELRTVDLHRAIEDAQIMIGADVAQCKADVQIAEEFPNVVANPLLLSHVLANLLSNAIKFVTPGVTPIVKVFAKDGDRHVRVFVQDNGIGIAGEYRDKIFGVFERLHSETEYPGTGIGLAIVRKAVLRMNGALGFESTIGKGSCFWIDLPKA